MRHHNKRRGVSEVVGVLLMLAIVVTMGVLTFGFASGGMASLSESYAAAMAGQANAAKEKFAVEQVAFASPGTLAIDGTSTNQVGGGSSSIATTLTTADANDVIVAYVSPADAGAAVPPSVSGISGGGLTWNHRVTTSNVTYVKNFVPITLTNSQGSATPNPFQQKVTWNPSTYSSYEASDLGNIRFCSDAVCALPLYAWLESCTASCGTSATSATAWVRLTSPIPGSGGTLTIYMVFLSTATEFDTVTNYWGEAPNLSGTYGQYDNGANVFTQYGGKSWSSFTTVEGTWSSTAAGPLLQTAATGSYTGGPAALIEGTSYAATGSYVLDTAFQYTTHAVARVGIVAVTGLNTGDPRGYRFVGQQSSNGAGFISLLNDQAAWVVNNVYAGATSTSYTMEVADNAGTWSGTLFSGYGTGGASLTTLAATAYSTANTATTPSTSGYVGVSAGYYTGTTVNANPASFQWFAMRALPPSNVMPATSFGGGPSTATFDLEEWYAIASSTLSSASITATLSTSDTAATWIAVFGISGANTASPFDPDVSLPATSAGATPSTAMSTSNANDMLLYGCAAGGGGMGAGFTSIYSNTFPPNQNEYVGYEGVSATQTNLATSCGTNSYGAEITDAVIGAYSGADIFVRNVGSVPTTLVSVYTTDMTSNSFVAQMTISATVNVGAFVEIVPTSSALTPAQGHTYSFTVTSSLGNSVTFNEEAN